jgi:polyisoprenoid-binding protein YceI
MFLGRKLGSICLWKIYLFSLAGFLIQAPALSAAQARELGFRFVPAQTTINFTVADTLHTIHGAFNLKSGDLEYDTKTSLLRGSLIVDATSGRSGNRTRDRRMHGEVLESARYPEIAFQPDRVDGPLSNSGMSTVQVHGVISIHGTQHELTIPVRMQMFPDHWVADSHFTVPYVRWGLKNPSRLLLRVSESVEIEIHASGVTP